MSENNKSYRIKTNVGSEYNGEMNINVNLLQDYDEFELLSLKIGTENLYKYHTAHYGCIVGRVLANGGVGVPNVKISSFIPIEDIDTTDPVFSFLYPYTSTRDKNRNEIRYNLLTDTKLDDCHQNVGTFPNKRLVLDDDNVIEIYDKYYKFTTTTNGSGDYMLFGLPVGNNIIHSDLDLSDIGILSQKPRDLFYKGYTAKQFENASQFKKDTNLDNLTQVISQDSSVYVFPFWGDETENEGQIKIVRNDIDVNYKFEPTCIFIGCIVSDEKSNAISKNCIPHERMGKMDRLTTGSGTIEMIRKTVSGSIESISIQGNELIDGNGTWCYQIPMNLDYMATDEYGNLVPTDNFERGIPTRTSVRFRVSLADYESDYENAHLVKVLVPNNPKIETVEVEEQGKKIKKPYIDFDYEFGSATKDSSFRDMFWNDVYTVKSYVPRFQKGNRQKNKNFTGFKSVNVNGANNPIPYNNMRINLTFLFVFQCLIFKSLVLIVKTLNKIIAVINSLTCGGDCGGGSCTFKCGGEDGLVYLTLDGGMCPSLEGNYIAPGARNDNEFGITEHTYKNVYGDEYDISFNLKVNDDPPVYEPPHEDGKFKTEKGTAIPYDPKSADGKNSELNPNEGIISTAYTPDDVAINGNQDETEEMKIYNKEDYFVKCVELQFAMEYEVIQFDFYNDWINGMIYIPRWFAEIKKNKDNAYYCGNTFTGYRYLTQQCALAYNSEAQIPGDNFYPVGCKDDKQLCHKRWGRKQVKIFGKNRGIVTARKNSRGQYAYYLRPSEFVERDIVVDGQKTKDLVKANLFSTDIVLLGSVLDCNTYGIPKVKGYTSSTYRMPPPTAEIVSDTQEMEMLSIRDKSLKCFKEHIQGLFTVLENRCVSFKNNVGESFYDTCYKYDKIDNCVITYGDKLNEFVDKIYNLNPNKYMTDNFLIDNNLKEDYDDITVNFYEVLEEYGNKMIKNYFDNLFWHGLIDELITTKNGEIEKCRREDDQKNDFTTFYSFEKRSVDKIQLDDENETTYSELSGIDWGYNPFDENEEDDTTLIQNQIAGHFLEIGCTFSLSNIKSCVNLQRVCELGGEISQSHYYLNGNHWELLSPSGIIAKREIEDAGIRTTFATLNSKKLIATGYDPSNGYIKYEFNPYAPVSFMGDLQNRNAELANLFTQTNENIFKRYGLIENQSHSYKAFRFGTSDYSEVPNRFLKQVDSYYYMPQYENSFYFYFGLRDGNTAIDRLYTEYYAQCELASEMPEISFRVEIDEDGEIFTIHYETNNMSTIKSVIVYSNDYEEYILPLKWDRKNSIIEVDRRDGSKYTLTMTDVNNKIVKSIVDCNNIIKDITTVVN